MVQKVSEILLRATTDNKQAIAGLQQIETELKRVQKATVDAQGITGLGTLTKSTASDALDYKQLADNAEAAQKASEAMAISAGQGLRNNVVAPLEAADVAAKKLIRDIGDLGKDIQRIPEPPLSSFGVAAGRGGRSVPGTLNTVRDSLIALPGVGYQNPAVVAVRGVSMLADRTGANFTDLAKGMGLAAAAGVIFAIGIDRINQELEGAKRVLSGALAAQRNYFEALGTLTTEQVDTQIEEIQRARPLLEQQAEELRGALDQAFSGLQDLPGIGDLEARLLFNFLPTADIKKQLDETEAAIQEGIQTEERLTQGRDEGVFVANDLREAEEKLADARKQALSEQIQYSLAAFETEKQMRLQLSELRRSGSSEQVQSQLAGNGDEIALLRSYLIPQTEVAASTGDKAAIQQLQEYRDRLQDLYQENRLLLGQVLPIIQAREAETAALQAQLGIISDSISYHQELASQIRTSTVEQVADRLEAIKEETQAIRQYLPQLQELAPTSLEAAQALDAAQVSLTRLSEDYYDQITRVLPAAQARALTELNTDLAQLQNESNSKLREIEDARLEKDADALEKRGDAYLAAEEKRGDALNDLADKQAQARVKIERKSNAEISNAVFARNALAAYLALQEKQEQLQTLKEDGEARTKELDDQFAKDRQIANRNYDRARQDAQRAADRAVQLERARQQAEYNERVGSYNAQLTLLRNFVTRANTELANLRVPSLASGLTSGASGGTSSPPTSSLPTSSYGVPPRNPQIGDTWTDAFGQLRVWTGNGWQSATAVRGYASGIANVPHDQLAQLHQGERVLTAQENRVFSTPQTQQLFGGRNGGGNNVNVYVTLDGKSYRAMGRAEALNALNDVFDDAGVDN